MFEKVLIEKNYFFIFNKPYAICVARIEPENNIHSILEAFSQQEELPLLAIGNWKNNKYGLSLLEKYTKFTHLRFLDPVYNPRQLNILRSNAFIYVHGHSAGGTNPSLVEAMSLGLPVFSFDCIYNRFTTENQCVYWSDADELLSRIQYIAKIKLSIIGDCMKEIASRRYIWRSIVEKYEMLYRK